MQVEALNVTGTTLQQFPKAAENIDASRRDLEKGQDSAKNTSSQNSKNGVQPEEILDRIKALSENGLYSVRFESDKEFGEMVVKVVDSKTGDVIRQIPAEEILSMKASLAKLSGNIVDTVK